MVIHFYIKYKTKFGQSLIIKIDNSILNVDEASVDVELQFFNEEYWYGRLETNDFHIKDILQYHYMLRETGKADKPDLCKNRVINLKKLDDEKVINVFDDWQDFSVEEHVFNSKPFLEIFGQKKIKVRDESAKNPSHVFEIAATKLPDEKVLCLSGAGKKMKAWDTKKPVLLKKKKGYWTVKLNLAKENFPVEYKFGVYDLKEKKVVYFEEGENRILNSFDKVKLTILHQFAQFRNYSWKGAGVNVPLSALKTEQSWGIGDFTDLNLLTDWALAAGIKLIQLLPVNDTTATHDRKDSYPYSAISAFALNPVFLNVQKLAIAASLEFPDELLKDVQDLNALPKLDYESVAKIKNQAIIELYEKDKLSFKDDFAYFDFFDLNRHWLVPYAAFCFLRDKYKTADFNKWKDYAIYDEVSIQEFVSIDKEYYNDIAIHYFTQYHLHLQLLDAVEYAHKNGIILKGDLPIGVGRFSVDTWMHPELFNMDMQAGAPPDAFTTKGQNWSFPTYNWRSIQADDYTWWRQRMEHMSNYFDAIRIDHILGFFRIWSIPMHATEGIFGRFIPAWPLNQKDFEKAGIDFNEERLCNPFFTDEMIDSQFGENARWVKENVLKGNAVKDSWNTQQKIAAYFKRDPKYRVVQQELYDLLANVVLLREDANQHLYHFRINMQDTTSYKNLAVDEQQKLNELYKEYFFENQDDLWYREAQTKLDAIQRSTNMLICAEDLGMVPDMVEDVLKSREILSLQVHRMPKKIEDSFSDPGNAPYLSVVTPSTHDMSTVREWWEENRENTQSFYNKLLGHEGTAPFYCEPWICKKIIHLHLQSPAMWSIFLLQDLLAMDDSTRRQNPAQDRINIPADPDHYWNYRMHVTLEFLKDQDTFSNELKSMIVEAGR